jgi:hypothetical protein
MFDRDEPGDRAIEALYPTFITSRGTDYVLKGPGFAPLVQALKDALAETTARSPLDRALLQIDLWSAFDRLAPEESRPRQMADRQQRAATLTPLLAALIRKVALTRAQIASLPDIYAAARPASVMPDLFSAGGVWLEVQMAPRHMHDDAADLRRTSRVFVRPRARPDDERRFLNGLVNDTAGQLAATALVMQAMLVDSGGHVVPARLFTDVQMRTFVRDGRELSRPDVDEFELSRRQLRADRSRAFVHFDASAPAYFATAGNDYDFATPAHDQRGETAPILTTLRSRCAMCHGPDGKNFMTFSLTSDPAHPLPPIVKLRQPNDDRARALAADKEARKDFKRLIEAAGFRR